MEAARLQVTVGADTRSAEGALSSFDQKLKSVASSMTKTGAAMTLGLTTPLVAAAKSALGMAEDYEQSMNVLQVSIGATDKQMAKMSERAMQLGAETSFSAGEAAEGMLELGKAGMNATQIYDAMPGVLALAAAGQISVAEASSVAASTLNAFGLEASETTRIADLLAGAANASQANISDLSQGMQQAGFAFKLANQPVEYLAASLALLTDQGLTGSDAGTALKNAFMRMVNPTGEATAEMEKLGISFYDASGNMKQLPDIIGMINTATEGLTNQQRDAALATIFLSDGMKAIIPLLDAGTEGFNKTVETVTEVGAATKVSDALMRGLGGGVEYLAGSVETFLLGAALPFTEDLGNMARAAGDLVTEIGNLPPDVLALALGFLAVTAAAGPTLVILGSLAGAVSALGAPLALAILGIIGLSFAWGLNLGGIRDKTAEIVPVIQEWFNNLSTDVAAVATAISTAFSNTTFPTIDELWADFQAGDAQLVATKIADAAGKLIVNLNTELKITATADAMRDKLMSIVGGVGDAIRELDLAGAKDKLSTMRDDVMGRLTEAVEGITWSDLTLDVQPMVTRVGEILGAAPWASLSFDVGGFVRAAVEKVTQKSNDILGPDNVMVRTIGQVSDVLAEIQNNFTGVNLDQPMEVLKSVVSSGVDLVGMFGAIKTDVKTEAIAGMQTLITNALNFSTELTNALNPDMIATAMSGFVSGFAGQVSAAFAPEKLTEMGAALGGLGKAITGKLGDILAAPEFGTDVGLAVGEATSAMIEGATAFVSGMMSQVSATDWTKFQADLDAFVLGFTGGVVTGLTNADWASVGTAIKDGVVAAIKLSFADKTVFDFLPGALGNILGAGAKKVDVPTFGDSIDAWRKLANIGPQPNLESTAAPAWVDLFLNGLEKQPGWVTAIVNIFTTEPRWVTSLNTWLNSDPGWLARFLSWNPFAGWLGGERPQDGTGGGGPSGGMSSPKKYSLRPPTDTQAAPEPLDWAKYVKPLEWMAYIKPFNWQQVTQPLAWQQFIQRMEWQTFVQPITWSQFVQMLNWSGYVARLSWNSFVSALGWNSYVGDLDWGSFVDKLDWGRFIDSVKVGSNAAGTSNWRGGLTWVGEEGAEIVDLPRGSRIYSNEESMAMTSGMTVNISVASLNNDIDIASLAMKVAREIARRTR